MRFPATGSGTQAIRTFFEVAANKTAPVSGAVLLFNTYKKDILFFVKAPQAHNRKKLVVQRRCYERVYKRVAAANVTFCGIRSDDGAIENPVRVNQTGLRSRNPSRRGSGSKIRTYDLSGMNRML